MANGKSANDKWNPMKNGIAKPVWNLSEKEKNRYVIDLGYQVSNLITQMSNLRSPIQSEAECQFTELRDVLQLTNKLLKKLMGTYSASPSSPDLRR